MTSSIEETLRLIQLTLEKVMQTGENVEKITKDSNKLGSHIREIDTAMQEVEASNQQLVDNMEKVSDIVETMTSCISASDAISHMSMSSFVLTYKKEKAMNAFKRALIAFLINNYLLSIIFYLLSSICMMFFLLCIHPAVCYLLQALNRVSIGRIKCISTAYSDFYFMTMYVIWIAYYFLKPLYAL